jgi:DUF4097 and DUF4098 domain-containing protein YvlB
MMRRYSTISIGVAALLAGSSLAQASDRHVDQQLPADPHGVVEISNVSGTVEVTGWDQSQVSINGDIPSDADNLDVKSERGHISITVRFPSMNFSFGGHGADLHIKVPRASEVDVTTVSADIASTGVTGQQRLKTVSGSVKGDFSQSDVEAKTVSGSVALRGDGKPTGLHLATISGTIRLEHAAGDVEASTTSGGINLTLDSARSVRMRTVSGGIGFRGKLTKDADFDTQTVSGDVRVHADSENGFEYDATTFSGDIEDCFNVKAEKTSRYAPGERLSGSLGNGSAHVRLKTMSGDIELCDKQ